ncbi:NADH-quinone oxidoreductase subunit NuoN [Antrihabitans cavernicola]|uniref:NADH-quinone oxidoreductase subunit N n=1 Tax=Antrihabitans cavernicola TaxID=2495913 RepID=A0A5A7S914_9NOCA|nr:NADH-quinone oxidoreductase subunit NuoN [Spelaeibacter cavernicola]KAA0021642.1 NADH-quinone oxidoreductase subunit NuoN [Spelaeibacter cavernicola]
MSTATVLALASPAPSIEWGMLSPMLIVFGVGVIGVLVEAFLPRDSRYLCHLVLGIGGLAAAFVAVVLLHGSRGFAVSGAVAIDGPTLFLQGTILLVGILTIMIVAERRVEITRGERNGIDAFTPQASAVPGSVAELEATKAGAVQTEVFPLTILAIGGMLIFPAANDLLTMFVALEVFSLPLYLLCALARRNRLLSQESAVKYFLLGAFSSAFFLFGIAMLYGYAGTVQLSGIGDAIRKGNDAGDPLLLIGIALVAVGLLFKVGAVPFHSWIPDVYQGAPTPITAFMASATKIAAFGAMLRIFYVALPDARADWRPILWGVAILTMLVGAILAVTQTDVKRMLAYSSVAHAGFILTGVIALNDSGLKATLFYLLAYGFSTLGAFAVVSLVRDKTGEATAMSRWAGVGRRSPATGAVFSLFLLAFAGIPLTSGFVSKFAVFQAAAEGGASPLVIVGVISSAIAAFFYVRVIVLMFFSEPTADAPTVVTPSLLTSIAIAFCAGATLALGVLPQSVLDLASHAGQFLH